MSHRTWLITGISSGFGREMAEQLLAAGDRVAGTVRRPDSVSDLCARYGDHLWIGELDVTDTPAVGEVVDRAFSELGRIDVVVNNAGYGLFGSVEELSVEQIDHQVATNLVGSIQVARAAIPHLRAQGGGRILQLSTYGGQATHPGGGMYHATKFGIEGFMESLAKDVAPFNIGITLIEPGGARTEFRFGSAQLAEPLSAYDNSPAAFVRGIRSPDLPSVGDPAKMVRAMIATVNQEPAPLRVALGSDSYHMLHNAYSSRLADLEAQQEVALSTDANPTNPQNLPSPLDATGGNS